MTKQKFSLGDRLTKGFENRYNDGTLGKTIDRRIEARQRQQFEKIGFTDDGLMLGKIHEADDTPERGRE